MISAEHSQSVSDAVAALLKHANTSYHRQCIVLSGEQSWCHAILSVIIRGNGKRVLFIGEHPPGLSGIIAASHKDALRFLGFEFDHAIIDWHDGIDPNVLGAVAGTVSGGGLLLLMLPALESLAHFDDPEKQRMAVWPHTPQDVGKRFLLRLQKIIRSATDVTLMQQAPHLSINVAQMEKTTRDNIYLQNDVCRTVDQQEAVEAICRVATGHRRRPLVISADRGRGKSAALGIASATLLQNGQGNIIVTGPRMKATDAVFRHAGHLLHGAVSAPGKLTWHQQALEFMAPDRLCQQLPDCRLLLVDEAAAIPAPMLDRLLSRYSRIVFSTTTYGYEGTGRGFAVKFQDTLHATTPHWRLLEMNTPIRWAPGDPLEAFVFRCLCLDAGVERVTNPSSSGLAFARIDRDDLLRNEALLRAIFGLLVLAHYQTQPRDLRYLLDGIGLGIYTVKHNGRLIATAVVEMEGGLDTATAKDVYRNERRVTGHLLAQTIESFAGITGASTARYQRVVRIAVHPDYRRRGVGRQLLRFIESDADKQRVDITGSTFGASDDLIRFWQNAGYAPAHIGLKRNASTGSHSITYVKALSGDGRELCQAAIDKFTAQFPLQLAEPYRDLSCIIAREIFTALAQDTTLPLTQSEWQDITSFANSLRGYEINRLPITKLISHVLCHAQLKPLPGDVDICLLIAKTLQLKPWHEVVRELGLQGKQNAVDQLRRCVQRVIQCDAILETIVVTQV